MNTLEEISQYIDKHQLITPNEAVVVGLSGGSDSVVLLHILISLGYKCIAAHCNFNLRGEESQRDEAFVRQFCQEKNITLFVKHFNTQTHADENRISIEMAARELRYGWFGELLKELNISHLAIAHHQDDSVETVLLNLIRGTGIKGLKGISPKSENIIRPLLCLTKKEINEYAEKNDLKYVDDSSNGETIYQRNKIRLEILPLMQQINPSVKDTINRMSQHLSQVEHIYANFIQEEKERVMLNNHISISELNKSIEPEALIFEILAPHGFNSGQIAQVYRSLKGISGKTFFSPTHRLVKNRDNLVIDKIIESSNESFIIDESTSSLNFPIHLKIERISNLESFVVPKATHTLCLDRDKISFPLILRRWEKGDWFVPFGMNGKKKLSDYFSDNKFSIIDKESSWILTSKNKIIWIVGHRSDNRFKVDNNTKRIVKITVNQDITSK
ncbi:MAG: tilS [Bacteroidetes bacterium]|nr:tilS [Bacteroidota bacterium]